MLLDYIIDEIRDSKGDYFHFTMSVSPAYLLAKNNYRQDALYLAAIMGKEAALSEIVDILLKAPPGRLSSSLRDFAQNAQNVLHWCSAKLPAADAIITMLASAAHHCGLRDYLNMHDAYYGYTPLHFACEQLQSENIKTLLSLGADHQRLPNGCAPQVKAYQLILQGTDKPLTRAGCLQHFAHQMYLENLPGLAAFKVFKECIIKRLHEFRIDCVNSPKDEIKLAVYRDFYNAYLPILGIHRMHYAIQLRPPTNYRIAVSMHREFEESLAKECGRLVLCRA